MRHARRDVLAFAAADTGGFFAHSRPFRGGPVRRRLPYNSTRSLGLLLLAGNRLGRPLAGASVGVGALAAHRQTTTMAQSAIAAEDHQPLDVHVDFASQIAFHHIVTVDDFANLQNLLVGELGDARRVGDVHLVDDLTRLVRPDAVDVLERDDHALVGRQVNTRDTGHGRYS